jgi:hypothetical protein
VDLPAPLALWALLLTREARLGQTYLHMLGRASVRILQRDGHCVLMVGAPNRSPLARKGGTEHLGEKVRAGTAAAEARLWLRIRDRIVCVCDLFELFGITALVRVVLHSELPIGFLDLIWGRLGTQT